MASSSPDLTTVSERHARLNPFAFPSDTAFRFVLLIVSVLGSSLLLYAAIFEALPPTRDYKRAQYEQCAREHDPTDFSGSYAERVARVLAYGECTAPADRVEAGWMLSGAAIVLIVASGIYWTFPARRIRAQRLLPIDASARDVIAGLAELCGVTDLSAAPTFVWSPFNAARSGLAFGHLRRYYVALTGGLITQLHDDRPAFRAVILHELAHLRNSDVDRTYFTIAMWQAFGLAALVPFAAAQLVSGRPVGDIADLSWRIVPLAALVYFTRNAVLRAREVYADVRASTWDGPSGALRRTVDALPRPPHGWWRTLWQVHPDPAERRRVLDDTRPLFGIHMWDAFATGVATGIALPNVIVLLGLLLPMPVAIVRPVAAALVCTPLAVGVVGLGVWRATFAALTEGRQSRGAGRAGIVMALGLVLGQELSLAAVEFGRGQGPVGDIAIPVLNIAWSGLLVVVLFVFFRWVAAGASTWLEVTADDPSPGQAYRIGLTIAGALLAAWLGVFFFVYLAVRTGGAAVRWSDLQGQVVDEAASPVVANVVGADSVAQSAAAILVGLDVLMLTSFVALCVYPLGAWLWRHRYNAPTVASWAFLDSPSAAIAMPSQPPLRPDRAAGVGLLGGLLYFAASFLVYSILFQTREPTASWVETVSAWTQFGTVALALVLQVAVAVTVAAWVRRLAVLHALFAALIAGCVMGTSTIVLLGGFGLLWDDWQLSLFFVSAFVITGFCAAGPLAVCVSAVAAYARRIRESSPATRDDGCALPHEHRAGLPRSR